MTLSALGPSYECPETGPALFDHCVIIGHDLVGGEVYGTQRKSKDQEEPGSGQGAKDERPEEQTFTRCPE